MQPSVGYLGAGSNFAISDDGTLVYVAGSTPSKSARLGESQARGKSIGSIPAAAYEEVRLSPTADRMLATRDGDIWIYELAGGRRHSCDEEDGLNVMSAWDPSGLHVAQCSSGRDGTQQAWLSPRRRQRRSSPSAHRAGGRFTSIPFRRMGRSWPCISIAAANPAHDHAQDGSARPQA